MSNCNLTRQQFARAKLSLLLSRHTIKGFGITYLRLPRAHQFLSYYYIIYLSYFLLRFKTKMENPVKLQVIKRSGKAENVQFDEITERIASLCKGLDMDYIDPPAIALKVITGLYSGVTTVELDRLAAETAAAMTVRHPDHAKLAARIAVDNLRKETKSNFSEVIKDLYEVDAISEEMYTIVQKNAQELNDAIKVEQDFEYNYFGFKTLERSYLLKINGKVAERPQHMLMRVAVGIHKTDIKAAIETYGLLSQGWFTHATPTLFNSCTLRPQLSSCFLLEMLEDSIDGIFRTLHKCALISKTAGGIGLSVSCIRATGSRIIGTNGTSNGLVPMLRLFNNAARYVDQGGNKRPGAFAIYLEPWHADIFEFIDLKKNTGAEELRARDLFYALWVPDLFMKRVNDDSYWSLMCPNESPGLHNVWGEKFEKLYIKYEEEGKYRKQIKARQLFFHIVDCQIETGMPYMLYKDACNKKSNQRNLGTIKSSNLCTEIVEFTSSDEIAVCNLASIALNKFVDVEERKFDFAKLMQVTKVVTKNLNRIIDDQYYPVPEARQSNLRNRPIGIGVQGLADAFILMKYPFTSDEARQLNKDIFEAIYFASCDASCELAELHGPYESYHANGGCPASHGQLQFDLWGLSMDKLRFKDDWVALKQRIAKFGLRNSLLIAPMPTASTAQILGNNESFEPYTSNVYCRRVLSGEFQVVNHHLIKDLIKLNLWNEDIRMQILRDYGSIENIDEIPREIKDVYKCVWDLPQLKLVEMSAERGPFIDQSQSLNIHMAAPNRAKVSTLHFKSWALGLKTGLYYLRTKPAANPIQFTLDKSKFKKAAVTENGGDVMQSRDEEEASAVLACSIENGPDCKMCSG